MCVCSCARNYIYIYIYICVSMCVYVSLCCQASLILFIRCTNFKSMYVLSVILSTLYLLK